MKIDKNLHSMMYESLSSLRERYIHIAAPNLESHQILLILCRTLRYTLPHDCHNNEFLIQGLPQKRFRTLSVIG